MIDYFFGKPRTGKSYRAVDIIYNDYLKSENSSPKFRNIITNIGGFKFKEINQTFQDRGSSSMVYKLVWKQFYEHLKKMYEMAMDDKDDTELNRYADYHKINDSLIVVDEASLYMKKYDDVISWWLSYHGHFRIRIIIIAQSPKQINAEYLVHAEIYYEAQPQSKQLTNGKLRYIHYADSYFSKDNKFSSDIINTRKEIYDLYKSGEVDKPKKILYKFIFFMFLSLIIMVGLYKLLMYRLSPDIPTDDLEHTNTEQIYNNTSNNIDVVSTLDRLIPIRCNLKHCWNPDIEYEKNQISISYFKYVISQNNLELQYSENSAKIHASTFKYSGVTISTLYELVDKYYFITKDIQNSFFPTLFIKRENKSAKKQFLPKLNTQFDEGVSERHGAP